MAVMYQFFELLRISYLEVFVHETTVRALGGRIMFETPLDDRKKVFLRFPRSYAKKILEDEELRQLRKLLCPRLDHVLREDTNTCY